MLATSWIKSILVLALLICAGQSAFAAITFGNVTTANSSGASVSFSHTVGAGSNRILIVGISIGQTTTANVISGVTYGGTPLTNVGNTAGTSNTMRVSLWRLVNPASGTANVTVTPVGGNAADLVAGATSYFGVDQTTPLGTFAQAAAGSGGPTVDVTSATNDLVVDAIAVGGALLGSSITVGAGQTQRYNVNTAGILGGGMIGGGSTEPGAATVTMSWNIGALLGAPWAIGAVALKPAPPTITKSFASSNIPQGGVTQLTLTITNPNPAAALTGVSFTDIFPASPAAMTLANTTIINTCGGTLTDSGGSSLNVGDVGIQLTNGNIAIGASSCSISVNITAPLAGSYANTTTAVSSTNSGTGNTGAATLTVLFPPTVAKSFSPNPVVTGMTSVLTVTLTNPNAGNAITGAAFTDTYPAQVQNSASPSGATTCAGGTVTAAANGSSVALSGGTIPAGGSCTVTVNVTSGTAGVYTNTIAAGALTTTNASVNAAAANDTLTVSSPLTLVKSVQTFSDPFNGSSNPKAIPGAFVNYTIVVTNPGAVSVDSNTVVITDPIPANVDLFVGNLGGAGSGPVAFTNGAPSSGLTYTFVGLGNAGDDVSFSSDNGVTFTYTPTANANGVDPAVTQIRINPKGTFNAGSNFQIVFRVQVK